jgi:hypothetical protein
MNRLLIGAGGMAFAGILIAVATVFVFEAQSAHALNSHSIDLESGSSQYLSASDASAFDITGDLTMEAWAKFESLPSSGNTVVIAGKYDFDNDNRSYYLGYVNVSGTYKLRLATSANCISYSEGDVTQTLSTGTWYHLAVSKNGTTATFYVNGASVGTATVNSSQCNSNAQFAVGALVANSAGLFFDGLIDDVRLWNLARSSTEIADDKSRELNGNETGLVGYWKLNNGLGDTSSSGNTLTNNNSATFSADAPFVGFSELLKVRKSADESATSTDPLQSDNDLKLSLAANSTYIIDGVLFASATDISTDLSFGLYAPTGSELRIGYINQNNEMVVESGEESVRIQVESVSGNGPTTIPITGTIVTGSTSGDVQLKWAPWTNNQTMTILEGSYLRADEI